MDTPSDISSDGVMLGSPGRHYLVSRAYQLKPLEPSLGHNVRTPGTAFALLPWSELANALLREPSSFCTRPPPNPSSYCLPSQPPVLFLGMYVHYLFTSFMYYLASVL